MDPDHEFYLMRIQIRLFTRIQIRILAHKLEKVLKLAHIPYILAFHLQIDKSFATINGKENKVVEIVVPYCRGSHWSLGGSSWSHGGSEWICGGSPWSRAVGVIDHCFRAVLQSNANPQHCSSTFWPSALFNNIDEIFWISNEKLASAHTGSFLRLPKWLLISL